MVFDVHSRKIFGDEHVDRLKQTKTLLVGSGGIGCELLKDLIMMNYGEIHILDLDTIDLSNLNRQFLFRQKDIKKSKSMTAVNAVQHFNHATKLVAHHGNIMDTTMFPIAFFRQFDIIFNALDNLEARFYVNKIALFTGIPLMESGTSGLKGQVQPIYPGQTECFECVAKETQKTFPVCTIRSTPSKPIHCITWAKNFLFPQLFGEDTSEEDKLKPQDINSDNTDEIEALLKETNEMLDLKRLISNSSDDDEAYIYQIIDKIFKEDIERLCMIDTLWKTRTKPTPLDYQSLQKKFPKGALDGQVVWSAAENLYVLVSATKNLAKRLKKEPIEFDKDDEDTLEFVVAAANLRSYIFHIELKSKFDIKQIAGNIIPAVATTNAIMAGFSALSSIHCFEQDLDTRVKKSRMVYDSNQPTRFINTSNLARKNPSCPACSVTRGVVSVANLTNFSIKDLRDALIEKYGYEDDVGIANGGKLLYDYDFEDNLDVELNKLCKYGDILFISDSEELLDSLELLLDSGDEGIVLPDLSIPPFEKGADPSETNDESDLDVRFDGEVVDLDSDHEELEGVKRKHEEEEEEEGGSRKRMKMDDGVEVIEL